jgi:predicted solute-binding protein
MPRDGSAKTVLQVSMSLRTLEDVERALNIALAATRILLQRNWNALSAILYHNLIRIQNFVSLNVNKATTNITLKPSLAANALYTSLIQQGQRSASHVTAIIVWTAFILFPIKCFLNVSLVIRRLRWTVKR